LRSRVVDGPDGAVLRLPRYAGAAFAAHPQVLARIGGRFYEGEIAVSDEPVLELSARTLESLGLGVDDEVDVLNGADL